MRRSLIFIYCFEINFNTYLTPMKRCIRRSRNQRIYKARTTDTTNRTNETLVWIEPQPDDLPSMVGAAAATSTGVPTGADAIGELAGASSFSSEFDAEQVSLSYSTQLEKPTLA